MGTLKWDQIEEIAKVKMPDLNTTDIEAAKRIIAALRARWASTFDSFFPTNQLSPDLGRLLRRSLHPGGMGSLKGLSSRTRNGKQEEQALLRYPGRPEWSGPPGCRGRG